MLHVDRLDCLQVFCPNGPLELLRSRFATVTQFLAHDEREERAEEVTADGRVAPVEDGGLDQGLSRARWRSCPGYPDRCLGPHASSPVAEVAGMGQGRMGQAGADGRQRALSVFRRLGYQRGCLSQ
jgi:hypothetical protein